MYYTQAVYNWANTAYIYMAMADYPMPASFLGPMPAYPVSVAAVHSTHNSLTSTI